MNMLKYYTNSSTRQLIEQYSIKIPSIKILSKDKQQIFADIIKDYCSTVTVSLVKLHNKLMKCLKQNKKTLFMKGKTLFLLKIHECRFRNHGGGKCIKVYPRG